jgi:hypothetical protein
VFPRTRRFSKIYRHFRHHRGSDLRFNEFGSRSSNRFGFGFGSRSRSSNKFGFGSRSRCSNKFGFGFGFGTSNRVNRFGPRFSNKFGFGFGSRSRSSNKFGFGSRSRSSNRVNRFGPRFSNRFNFRPSHNKNARFGGDCLTRKTTSERHLTWTRILILIYKSSWSNFLPNQTITVSKILLWVWV